MRFLQCKLLVFVLAVLVARVQGQEEIDCHESWESTDEELVFEIDSCMFTDSMTGPGGAYVRFQLDTPAQLCNPDIALIAVGIKVDVSWLDEDELDALLPAPKVYLGGPTIENSGYNPVTFWYMLPDGYVFIGQYLTPQEVDGTLEQYELLVSHRIATCDVDQVRLSISAIDSCGEPVPLD